MTEVRPQAATACLCLYTDYTANLFNAESKRDFRFSLLQSKFAREFVEKCAEPDVRKHHEKQNQMTLQDNP